MLKKLQSILRSSEAFTLTQELKDAVDSIEQTNENLFITGKAGTGKSTLIEYVRGNTKKKIVVLAPTGISAINIHGQTIHSFFQLPPRLITRDSVKKVFNDRIYKDVDTIIIDEISMVRADVIDGIDYFLRLNGKDKSRPFGGIQMVFVGDLYQLPPVLRREEAAVFGELYNSPYFFSAGAFDLNTFSTIELSTIFRQRDSAFIDLLNAIRIGSTDSAVLEPINTRFDAGRVINRSKYTTLTATNAVAGAINESELNKIQSPEFTYTAIVEGNFPTENTSLPAELELKLKKGARVMFVKNDKGRMWVNGTVGIVDSVSEHSIKVRIDDPQRSEIVDVLVEEWQNIRYEIDPHTDAIKEKVIGVFRQYPLRLAWAITIHKSQGMTFDNVNIDFSSSPFAHGQTYVALSRCRSIKGIVLSKKIYPNDVIVDERIISFSKRI